MNNLTSAQFTAVRLAVQGIRNLAECLAQAEQLDDLYNGEGRYVAEIVMARYSSLGLMWMVRDSYLATINRFSLDMTAQGLDPQPILQGLGWREEFRKISVPMEVSNWF